MTNEKQNQMGSKGTKINPGLKYRKILVLCIDRDDDIGSKTGLQTPLVGRESCIYGGTRLALFDPEDSDSNAIFAAVKTYEDLLSKGFECEVAIIAGKYNRGVDADEKILYEIQNVLLHFQAEGSVIVSDGEDDETVIPVIQSLLPIISLQRVVIRHSRTVEYSYAVFARYIKMLVFDPRYSKFFLGVPGALLVASGLSIVFGLTKEAIALVLGILGSAFIIRAFDIDKSLGSLGKPTPTSFIKIFSIVAGILIIIVSLINGFSNIPENLVDANTNTLKIFTNKQIMGKFIEGTITFMWIGIGTIFGGLLLSNWFKGSIKTIYDILRLVVLGLLYYPLYQFAKVLTEGTNPFSLVSSLLIGLAVTLIAATFLFQYYRNRRGGESLKH